MGLKIRHNGEITEFTGAKYEPGDLGSMRLNIRTGAGANGIKKYGLATSASHSSDKKLRLRVNGDIYYIGTSSSASRQSDYTSYSSYYTYTYTQTSTYTQSNTYTYQQTQQRNSVLTRTGTQTTATKTMPAKYTYRASYYTGKVSSYTVSSYTILWTQEAKLSHTRSSQYTAQFSLYWNRTNLDDLQSATYQAANAQLRFTNPNNVYSYTTRDGRGTASFTSSSTYPGTNAYSASLNQYENYYHSGTYTANCVQRYAATTSRTVNTVYYATTSKPRTAHYTRIEFATASRSSTYYSQAPNYILLLESSNISYGATGTKTVAAANYKSSTSSVTGYDGVSNNVSYRRKTSRSVTAPYNSSTYNAGAATLTSTATPIGGVPSNYTLSNGPASISSQASYTYTDADCTRTYVSNYSTSYWTVTNTYTNTQTNTRTATNTYNSNPWYSSSQGSTITTRSSGYTDHNFI